MTPQEIYCLVLTFLVCGFAAWTNWSSQSAWKERIRAVQEHSAKHWAALEVENNNLRNMVTQLHRNLLVANKSQPSAAPPQVVNGTPRRMAPAPHRERNEVAGQVFGTDENLEG